MNWPGNRDKNIRRNRRDYLVAEGKGTLIGIIVYEIDSDVYGVAVTKHDNGLFQTPIFKNGKAVYMSLEEIVQGFGISVPEDAKLMLIRNRDVFFQCDIWKGGRNVALDAVSVFPESVKGTVQGMLEGVWPDSVIGSRDRDGLVPWAESNYFTETPYDSIYFSENLLTSSATEGLKSEILVTTRVALKHGNVYFYHEAHNDDGQFCEYCTVHKTKIAERTQLGAGEIDAWFQKGFVWDKDAPIWLKADGISIVCRLRDIAMFDGIAQAGHIFPTLSGRVSMLMQVRKEPYGGQECRTVAWLSAASELLRREIQDIITS